MWWRVGSWFSVDGKCTLAGIRPRTAACRLTGPCMAPALLDSPTSIAFYLIEHPGQLQSPGHLVAELFPRLLTALWSLHEHTRGPECSFRRCTQTPHHQWLPFAVQVFLDFGFVFMKASRETSAFGSEKAPPGEVWRGDSLFSLGWVGFFQTGEGAGFLSPGAIFIDQSTACLCSDRLSALPVGYRPGGRHCQPVFPQKPRSHLSKLAPATPPVHREDPALAGL